MVNNLAPARSPGAMVFGIVNKGAFEYYVGAFNGKGQLNPNTSNTPEGVLRLRFAPWRAGDALVTNRYGIPEPDVASANALRAEDMALIVLPLVGFDANGHRLGMGGGWYDRSLAFRHADAAPPWLVGAAFETQRLDAIAAEAWDVRLDAVCTEAATYLAGDPA